MKQNPITEKIEIQKEDVAKHHFNDYVFLLCGYTVNPMNSSPTVRRVLVNIPLI